MSYERLTEGHRKLYFYVIKKGVVASTWKGWYKSWVGVTVRCREERVTDCSRKWPHYVKE